MGKKAGTGSDPAFPYLDENERFNFPPPENAKDDSLVAWGGNLSPGMLLSAYEQGIFPWYGEGEPVLWHSPDPRFVIFPEKLHISKSMRRVFNAREFEIRLDTNFRGVISSCAEMYRPGQGGTWITRDMIEAYTKLHELGWAHSAEAYAEGILAGGCYGIRLGNCFFGESMFARKSNASKTAFLTLAQILFDDEVSLIDCQVYTSHLESLGAEEIDRGMYLKFLQKNMTFRLSGGSAEIPGGIDRRGNWGRLYGPL
jgi:leucyl/phenylalanyl-tRNA--protein transferase